MTLAVNDIVQVTAYFVDGRNSAQVVRHYKCTVVSEDDDLLAMTALMTFLTAHWTNTVGAVSTVSAAVVCYTAQKVGLAASRVFTLFEGNGNGQVLGEANAAQLAVLVSIYSADTSDAGRGRMYIPFPAEANSEGGVLINTAADDILAAITPMLVDFTDAADNEWEPGVWSRTTSVFNRCTDFVIRPVLATQRRRRTPLQPFAT